MGKHVCVCVFERGGMKVNFSRQCVLSSSLVTEHMYVWLM